MRYKVERGIKSDSRAACRYICKKKRGASRKKRKPKRDSGSVRVLGYISGGLSTFFLFFSLFLRSSPSSLPLHLRLPLARLPFPPSFQMKKVTRGQIKSEFKETKERAVAEEKIVVFHFVVGGRNLFFCPLEMAARCSEFAPRTRE